MLILIIVYAIGGVLVSFITMMVQDRIAKNKRKRRKAVETDFESFQKDLKEMMENRIQSIQDLQEENMAFGFEMPAQEHIAAAHSSTKKDEVKYEKIIDRSEILDL